MCLARGELVAEVIDNDLRAAFRAGTPASSPDNQIVVGTATQFLPITGAKRGIWQKSATDVADTQSTLYDALEQAELTLRIRNIIDTGEVDYRPFMVMHPVHWHQLQRFATDKNFLTDRFGRFESGEDIVQSRGVGTMFGFDIYVDTGIGLVSASPDYVPIYFGNPQALAFALSESQSNPYPPGTIQGEFGWTADYRRRYGFSVIRPELCFQLRVTAAVD